MKRMKIIYFNHYNFHATLYLHIYYLQCLIFFYIYFVKSSTISSINRNYIIQTLLYYLHLLSTITFKAIKPFIIPSKKKKKAKLFDPPFLTPWKKSSSFRHQNTETKIPDTSSIFIYHSNSSNSIEFCLPRVQIQLYPLIASLPNTKYKHDRALTWRNCGIHDWLVICLRGFCERAARVWRAVERNLQTSRHSDSDFDSRFQSWRAHTETRRRRERESCVPCLRVLFDPVYDVSALRR